MGLKIESNALLITHIVGHNWNTEQFFFKCNVSFLILNKLNFIYVDFWAK